MVHEEMGINNNRVDLKNVHGVPKDMKVILVLKLNLTGITGSCIIM